MGWLCDGLWDGLCDGIVIVYGITRFGGVHNVIVSSTPST